jgi:hypothetical protein
MMYAYFVLTYPACKKNKMTIMMNVDDNEEFVGSVAGAPQLPLPLSTHFPLQLL